MMAAIVPHGRSFTSPCKGEVGVISALTRVFDALWRRVGVNTRPMTPTLTLPLSGGGNAPAPLIKSQLLCQLSYAHG